MILQTNYDKVANNVMDVVENAGREFVGAITSRILIQTLQKLNRQNR